MPEKSVKVNTDNTEPTFDILWSVSSIIWYCTVNTDVSIRIGILKHPTSVWFFNILTQDCYKWLQKQW